MWHACDFPKYDVPLESCSLIYLETLRAQDESIVENCESQKAAEAQQKRETKVLSPAVLDERRKCFCDIYNLGSKYTSLKRL